jgi:hypothetical protein
MAIKQVVDRLTAHLTKIPARYQQFSEEVLLRRPAPNKWSKKEILGHLCDSALNNLKRFEDIQCSSQPYAVVGYKQDDLIAINRYQELPLDHVLLLWRTLNQQIIHVISTIPADKLSYTVLLSSGESKTLEWLVVDYIEHMDHHWKQAFG